MVDIWVSPEWVETHIAARERRLMMPGPAHHQGSLSLEEFSEKWSASHGGKQLSEFQAIAVAHMGKATSDARYNPEAGPEAYNNPMVHSRLNTYTEMGKQKYGADWDPSQHPIDGEIVMRMSGGKRHGRYAIGDSSIDTASTPTLSQIRAGGANPDIRPRTTVADFGMQTLQTQLDEERKRRQELEAVVEAQRQQRRILWKSGTTGSIVWHNSLGKMCHRHRYSVR